MIAPRYHELLDHLERTVTLSTLERNENVVGIGLRHDVDHDLGVALDMAKVEYERSMPATYFLLHTAEYCRDPLFLARCQQLVAYGHEIGLHLDALGGWYRGEFDDVHAEVASWLERVRGVGIEVRLSAAHGARVCYDGGFINNWIWRELRGDNPQSTEDGLSAEGIAVEDPAYCVAYPAQEEVVRPDGARMALWQVSMRDLGIEAEACRIPVDRYWSDSGGTWTRSPDPMEHDLQRDRNQVLVHPWWWQEPRRTTLVLGTARSGTKWLCGRLGAGTSATVLHERTLNQDGTTTDPVLGLKRTAGDLVSLLENKTLVSRLSKTALAGHRRTKRNVVEANVYLPHVDPELFRCEDVSVVHLYRDPTRVVRSILQRGWYDTPNDWKHPRIDIEGWDSMTRFERACAYWAETNRSLMESFPDAIRVSLEELQHAASFESLVGQMGFVLHLIPFATTDSAAVDTTMEWTVPPVEEWSADDLQVFFDRCGPVAALLGYQLSLGVSQEEGASPARCVPPQFHARKNVARPQEGDVHRCQSTREPQRSLVVKGEASATGAWAGLLRNAGWNGGQSRRLFQRAVGMIEGRLESSIEGEAFVGRLFAVELDTRGKVVRRRPLLRLDADQPSGRFSFRIGPGAVNAVPVIFVDQVESDWRVSVDSFEWVGSRGRGDDHLPSTRRSKGLSLRSERRSNAIESCMELEADQTRQMRGAHLRRKVYQASDYVDFILADFAAYEKMTLQEYVRLEEIGDRRILLIRHDVDHDLETAVRMAEWESAHGIRATYCLLHTAWYWGKFDGRRYRRTRDLVRAGDRILELGHEINLHNNFATLALQTGCEPGRVLEAELGFMRDLGWPVTGTATHGDRLCRELGYRNFEIFAEGVKPELGGPRVVHSESGAVRLGLLRQADYGLEYEAYDIHRDIYITDSGGRLRGQRDAPGRRAFGRHDSSRGSVTGILTHPLWWDFREADS